MNKKISSKSIALTFGILVLVFVVGFYIFAWTEPTEEPPEGNVTLSFTTEERVRSIVAEMSGTILATDSATTITNPFYNQSLYLTQGDEACEQEFGEGWRWCDASLWDKYIKTLLPEDENFLLKGGLQSCRTINLSGGNWWTWTYMYYYPVGSWTGDRSTCITDSEVAGPEWYIYTYKYYGDYWTNNSSCSAGTGTSSENVTSCTGHNPTVISYYSVDQDWKFACCPPAF